MDQYYKPEHLPQFSKIGQGSPELAEKFFAYYGAVFAEGALSKREKALIALAVAHTVQCPYCIEAYSKECLQQGSDVEQMTEAVHVATAIRGGSSLIHGLQMLDQVDKLSM
jgi:alkylhydroperoxidase/carboxymuconolactone decarboxylase family protein